MAIVKRVQYHKPWLRKTRADIRLGIRLEGVRKIAEREGVSREWVWMVRTGRGTSARIAAALKAEGISVEPRRRGR